MGHIFIEEVSHKVFQTLRSNIKRWGATIFFHDEKRPRGFFGQPNRERFTGNI